MKRWLLMLALMTATAGWVSAADAVRGKGADVVDGAVEAVRGPEHESHRWAGKRLEALREDFDRFERRLEKTEPERRVKARFELGELKERVSTLEGRIEEKGKIAADDKVYEDVEDEIEDIRGDFRDLRREYRRQP